MPAASEKVRLRFAPSPTGYLHIGGARTALYNYLYARKNGGSFILRIEDTDEARSTDESLRRVMEDLQWLGLEWDEGPHPETLVDQGPLGPYRQSRRLAIYRSVAEELLRAGKAYYCFMTDAEIEAQKQQAQQEGRHQHLNSPYQEWPLERSLERIKAGDSAVVRFRTSVGKEYVLHDLVRGEVRFPSDMVGDFVLLRSGGMPVYNFCCVVDDHLMKISHVLRAEEHLPNSLRQMMIYESMGWELPRFGHLSLVLDEDRKKLSKRRGATSCHEFKLEGFLPEALNNYICLLGWSHPEEKEILTGTELIDAFSLDRFHPAGAAFDIAKLRWINATHLRAKSDDEIWRLIDPFLKEAGLKLPEDPAWHKRSVAVFKTNLETLVDAVELYRPISDPHFAIVPEGQETLAWESSRKVIETWKGLLQAETSDHLTGEGFLKLQDRVKEMAQVKGKFLFMPIRVAVIGKPHGTELKILVPLISRHSLIQRAEKCLS
ncbi:MAG: glutamate--tRNA ligase [Bdellovibrio sp.]|nr:MAG: glutamate--tRNA ligase [Bdellovibrio sp.]